MSYLQNFFGLDRFKNKFIYLFTILPLLLSILVQRSEHIIDNRFISLLGDEPLKIHSIFYIFLIMGQSIGIASSSSLLTLWKRVENSNRQFDIAKKHFVLTFLIAASVAMVIKLNLGLIINHFQIESSFLTIADNYLNLGILNIVIQAILGLTLALLIANDLLSISFILMGILFIWKFAVGHFSTVGVSNTLSNPTVIALPMMMIGKLGLIAVVLLILLGIYLSLKKIKLNERVSYSNIFEIWNAEVVVSFMRALSPAIFSLQIANLNIQKNFFVIYQLSLQAAYLLVLPMIAANQIAVREASKEQSLHNKTDILKLKDTQWFKDYFACILVPNIMFLLSCAIYPKNIFKILFNYSLDSHQIHFVSIYLIAVAIGQIGNFMIVRLRSAKLNRVITLNTFFAEIIVQLGLMQILIYTKMDNPILIGVVALLYCIVHFFLNFLSVRKYSERT